MKAFKGFDKDMKCRGFQFEEGRIYHEESAKLCEAGFHACEDPLDVFGYYVPGKSVYREVDLEDVTEERGDDSKRCGKTIKIGAALDIRGLCKAHFEYVKSHITNESNAKPGKPATAGNRGAATAGYCGAATAGNCGAATAGEYGAATAGYCGAATVGNRGAATSRGMSATGEYGISVARGNGVKVKGGMGALLVLAIENDDDYLIKDWASGIVDGKALKSDTWYTVRDGQFVEVEE